jgi:hypothetical protein
MTQTAPVECIVGNKVALRASSIPGNVPIVLNAMTKTIEAISEAIRDPKHPFRKVDDQPKKPQKHRYERRKVKSFLHLSDWQIEEAT